MANWQKIKSRGRVDDRRAKPAAIAGFGGGALGLVAYLVIALIAGGDKIDILSQLQSLQSQNQVEQSADFAGLDEYEQFASTVLGSTNQVWNSVFGPRDYREPTLVLFRQATRSGCGYASSQVGPHYCPLDKTIYIDETFFDLMVERFGAEGGDVAEAYVIAHEVGHHVQNELGILDKVRQAQQAEPDKANEYSVQLELQADCFAGIWANSLKGQDVFLPGEITEAIDAAEAVGDDRIQEQVSGQTNPETWTHGSSQQRADWFNVGYQNGNPENCDTFAS